MTRTTSQSPRRLLVLVEDDATLYPELYALGYNGKHREGTASVRMLARVSRRTYRPRMARDGED